MNWGGFLVRRSSAIRRFIAGFLTYDNRTIMKSFLKKIAPEFSGNFGGFLCKFLINSRAIFLRNDFIIVRPSHFRNPAINLRIAELRLMRNPPQNCFNEMTDKVQRTSIYSFKVFLKQRVLDTYKSSCKIDKCKTCAIINM